MLVLIKLIWFIYKYYIYYTQKHTNFIQNFFLPLYFQKVLIIYFYCNRVNTINLYFCPIYLLDKYQLYLFITLNTKHDGFLHVKNNQIYQESDSFYISLDKYKEVLDQNFHHQNTQIPFYDIYCFLRVQFSLINGHDAQKLLGNHIYQIKE